MGLPPWVSEGAGFVGALCFTLMLVPQILLNYRKQSTEGLSLSLVGIWHFAQLLMTAFYLIQPVPPPAVLVSMASFLLASSILEGQAAAYRPAMDGAASSRRTGVLVSVCSAMVAVSLLATALLVRLLLALPAAGVYLVGDVLASALLALGFLPQYYEFLASWCIDGYSFGVTAFDVVGSIGNTITLFAPPGVRPLKALAAAAPFLTIIGMHVVLLIIAGTIVCSGRRQRGEPALSPGEADMPMMKALSGRFDTPSSARTPSPGLRLSEGAYKCLP
mmetsp:Transcript_4417/g.12005  ORF Transcript_4417/g.12005 Transcript_4417/m.12005 type:complete len:276 (-) Transcript_4417:28-855(-)